MLGANFNAISRRLVSHLSRLHIYFVLYDLYDCVARKNGISRTRWLRTNRRRASPSTLAARTSDDSTSTVARTFDLSGPRVPRFSPPLSITSRHFRENVKSSRPDAIWEEMRASLDSLFSYAFRDTICGTTRTFPALPSKRSHKPR